MRWAIGVEYRGTRFAGWQRQPDCLSVQEHLEFAIEKIAGHPVQVYAAGRTDRGVHASMQVVHFDVNCERSDNAWVRGVNSFLTQDVAVLWSRAVPEEFHARFSAVKRHYRYFIYSHPVRPTLLANQVGWTHQSLKLDEMQRAASYMLGTHDFSAFRSSECQAKSPIKHLEEFSIELAAVQPSSGVLYEAKLTANAFLHHMVRNLIGAAVFVGAGNRPSIWMQELLQAKKREFAAPMFAADGLYLAGVLYPDEFLLPSWNETSRLAW
ncbi:tRNA pseudouridine(38-40) synthase TruA [Leeia sp. TBRC 13508]|uniref:tRNA pseudouridine synthase A n=1 Tax=Leeia speluncae TaxID=2884804 RepID=A0ABS8DAU6_9NEIS|nr:tRNA pseudouridine(38-40) synthase TruA [Leeia speluncae]MCB6185252.1 tRNA pseudouridine(38-40) synthase TruA [Leeia speluncae]